MLTLHWLRALSQRLSFASTRRRSQGQLYNRLEPLECRMLLTTLTVNTAADVVDANDGVLSLREAVDEASAGDEITFDTSLAGVSVSVLNDRIYLNKDLTITGLGATRTIIDGGGVSSLFKIKGGKTVEISGVTLTNAYTSLSGGALRNGGNLTIRDSILTGNVSGDDGGAIFSKGGSTSPAMLTIINSTLSNNISGDDGGAINSYNASLTIIDSNISGNSSDDTGGGVGQVNGTTLIQNSTISGNSAGRVGGGLHGETQSSATVRTVLVVSGSSVSDNVAQSYGGGISMLRGNLTIQDGSSVRNNQAARNGGGVWSHGDKYGPSIFELLDSELSGNRALSGDGGGLYTDGPGGDTSSATVINSLILNNSAGDDGGGIALRRGTLTVSGSEISENRAKDDGGGIYNLSDDKGPSFVTIAESRIENNSGQSGGGIANFSGTVDVILSVISGNSVTGDGGGIRSEAYSGRMAALTIEATTIADNISGDDGGGVYAASENYSTQTVSITSSAIYNNRAADDGGGMYLKAKSSGSLTASLTNVTISGNRAADGGGIYIVQSSGGIAELTLLSSTLTNNTASGKGGGIRVKYNPAVYIGNTIIAGNSAGRSGPDVYGTVISLGHNLIGNTSGSKGFGAEGDLLGSSSDPLDPGLTPLQDNGGPTLTHGLLSNSSALDAGDDSLTPLTDQRGELRTGTADIGAYEL